MSNEHTILVAFTVEAGTRKDAEDALTDVLPDVALDLRSDHLTSWWIAEDDRHDGSDNDSAVFVNPGQQRQASIMLNLAGLTPECNVVPRRCADCGASIHPTQEKALSGEVATVLSSSEGWVCPTTGNEHRTASSRWED